MKRSSRTIAGRQTFLLFVVLVIFAVLSTGCLAGANEQIGSANAHGVVAGFWRGLWHGIIAPITFVVSLFTDNVQVYEVHNNGAWYDGGFLFGLCCIFGGSGTRARRSKSC